MINKKELGLKNKKMGINAEIYYMNQFHDLGFKHCKVSSITAKMFDNAGIDLLCLPFNVQIKTGKQKGMKPVGELEYMLNKMKSIFPKDAPELKLPKILIHKKPLIKGKKENEFYQIVTMTFEDFKKIIKDSKYDNFYRVYNQEN